VCRETTRKTALPSDRLGKTEHFQSKEVIFCFAGPWAIFLIFYVTTFKTKLSCMECYLLSFRCCVVRVNRRFGQIYHLHIYKFRPANSCTPLPCSTDFLSWRRRWHILPKCRFAYGLHGAIFQKVETLTTFVRTWNSACCLFCLQISPIIYAFLKIKRHRSDLKRGGGLGL
jgi:hypothetical protein